ncbi:deformed epidermal autoregulatory factor 1 homolog [Salvelinus fontinalis]|uniref:deformed epidermal autoregulatory factor 1 homolog n=1 Tax=Salvelinus fontinalis TaxID=8038 RepID=UPI002486A1BC|nr:deformed epidermal autoregulatory factor 1 homolog [Salvelinus fontinalis]
MGNGVNPQKATLTVVHTHGSIVNATGLMNAPAAMTSGPQTPSTPMTLGHGKNVSKHNWDPFAYNIELPVCSMNTSGMLYKIRLVSCSCRCGHKVELLV